MSLIKIVLYSSQSVAGVVRGNCIEPVVDTVEVDELSPEEERAGVIASVLVPESAQMVSGSNIP